MSSATVHKIIAIMYVALGLFMAYAVPIFNQTYESFYPDWNTNHFLLIQAFHWPLYVWPAAGFVLAAIVYLIGVRKSGSALKKFNIAFIIIYVLLLVHIIDWLVGFIFCHEWGCTRLLPTWSIIQWLNT